MCCLLMLIVQNEFKSASYILSPERIDGSNFYRVSFLGAGKVEQSGMEAEFCA